MLSEQGDTGRCLRLHISGLHMWLCLHRSFEDIEEAAKPGGICAQGGRHSLSVSQAFSLRHRADLLEDLTAADVQEMREVVLDVLGSMAGKVHTAHASSTSPGGMYKQLPMPG